MTLCSSPSRRRRASRHARLVPLVVLLLAGLGSAAPAPAAVLASPQDPTGIPLPETAEGIGPGTRLYVLGASAVLGLPTSQIPGMDDTIVPVMDDRVFPCTASFLFSDKDNGKIYLGTAGHCVLDKLRDPESTHTNAGKNVSELQSHLIHYACVRNCTFGGALATLPDYLNYKLLHETLDTSLFNGDLVQLGPVVYGRWALNHQEEGNDFGLIEIPEHLHHLLRPGLPVWGTPQGEAERNILGKSVCYYGNSIGLGEVFPTMGRTGVGIKIVESEGWFSAMAPISGGDSGSAVATCKGSVPGVLEADKAVGTQTHLVLPVCPIGPFCYGEDRLGILLGTTLQRGMDLAQKDAGISVELVESLHPARHDQPEAACPTSPGPHLVGHGSGFTGTNVFEGTYDAGGNWSRPLARGPFDIRAPEFHRLPAGPTGPLRPHVAGTLLPLDVAAHPEEVEIPIVVYRPDVPDHCRLPTIVRTGPYFSAMTPQNMDPPRTGKEVDTYEQLVQNFVPWGFAVAMVAPRGTADAGGCLDLLGRNDQRDLDLAFNWLANRSWSNGNIGVVGLSNEGATTWMAAALGNEHVKTIAPMATWPDTYELMFHNGARTLMTPVYIAGFYAINPITLHGHPGTSQGGPQPEELLCPTEAATMTAAVSYAATLHRRDDPFKWFEDRDFRQRILDSYQGSVFVVHGLQDTEADGHNPFPFATQLEAEGIPVKQLYGQWYHDYPDERRPPMGPTAGDEVLVEPCKLDPLPASVSDDECREVQKVGPSRWDFAEVLLHWLTYWLWEDAQVDLGPRAQVQDSTGAWHSETAFPPVDAATRMLQLSADGRLSDKVEDATALVPVFQNPIYYPYVPDLDDNGLISEVPKPDGLPCPGCPQFRTPPLEETLLFAGIPELDVTIEAGGATGELVAYLHAISPEANDLALSNERTVKLLGFSALRVGLTPNAGLSPTGTSPESLELSGARRVTLDFEPLDAVVPKNFSLVLTLTQGSAGENLPAENTPMLVRVGNGASTLRIREYERDAGDFFQLPGVIE